MRVGSLTLPDGTLETAWWGPEPEAAPTLVLLHEGLGCIELWRDVPERLAAATGWGVFAYSRFGYGQSDLTPLPRPMNYMQHEAEFILPQVLSQAGVRRTVLCGHSDGGSIAAVYAGLPSSSTTLLGLVTVAAHFFVEDLNIASIRRIKLDYETGDLRQRLARYHRDVDVAFRGWSDAWLDPRFRNFDIIRYLPNIRVPVLGLQGADDPYGTEEQLMVLRANTRAAETALIPNARHAPHLEAKTETLAAVSRFVGSVRTE